MADEKHDRPEPTSDVALPTTQQADWPRIVVRYGSTWRPPTDVYEQDGRLIILIEIAGIQDGDFQLVLQERHLVISGVRRLLIEAEHVAVHQMEIPRGEFRTHVYLPWNINREQVTALYRDGLLRIELPQAPAQRIRIINVKADETEQSQSDD